jgi:DNA-binding HxlR family transcriptional regulator
MSPCVRTLVRLQLKVEWLHEDNSLKRLAKHYGCPVELSLDILGGKWKPVILSRLKERPYRYSELRRLIPNLSTKMLTQRLHDLELQGLVERRGISGRPHALYGLTARATSLKPVLQALYDWGHRTATELKVEIGPPSSTHR